MIDDDWVEQGARVGTHWVLLPGLKRFDQEQRILAQTQTKSLPGCSGTNTNTNANTNTNTNTKTDTKKTQKQTQKQTQNKHILRSCLASQANAWETDKTTLNRATCLVPKDGTCSIAAAKIEPCMWKGFSPVESFVYKRRPMSKNCRTFWWRSSQLDEGP